MKRIVRRCPSSIEETSVFQALLKKSTPSDGAASKTLAFVKEAKYLADLTLAGPFREYTLHNRDHSVRVTDLFSYLMADSTLERLTAVELQLLIYGAFLHDLGMALAPVDRSKLVQSDEFSDALSNWPEINDLMDEKRSLLLSVEPAKRLQVEADIFQLQEAVLASILRSKHAEKKTYIDIIERIKSSSSNPALFMFRDVSFESALIDICHSHNNEASTLLLLNNAYEDVFSRDLIIGGEIANVQFCAALLRLADIMDFDGERTPRILFESLGIASLNIPGNAITLREWNKHMAVQSLALDADELLVSGESTHPVVEKSVRDFCAIIEAEFRDTSAVLRRNTDEVQQRYELDIPLTVRAKLTSVGYIYTDMSLRLNESAIMTLLMGDRLYSEPAVCIRELIQNAIDACTARSYCDRLTYSPHISVQSFERDGRLWIDVTDNGLGMDEHVLSEYFLKLGNSYHSSPEFRRLLGVDIGKLGGYVPISRFGIGIASVFLIADAMEVNTKCDVSPRHDFAARTVRIEKAGALAFVTSGAQSSAGTTISLRLKKSIDSFQFALRTFSYLKGLLTSPVVPIKVDLFGYSAILKQRSFFVLKPDAHRIAMEMGLRLFLIDLGENSTQLQGRALLVFAEDDGKLSYKRKVGQIIATDMKVLSALLTGFRGNQVSVNGFRMSAKKVVRFPGFSKSKSVKILFELNAQGTDDLGYDVSRNSLSTEGRNLIVGWLQASVVEGLKKLNAFELLTAETAAMLTNTVRYRAENEYIVREQDLSAIREFFGINPLTVQSVDRLLSNGLYKRPLIRKAIRHLISTDELTMPSESEMLEFLRLNPILGSTQMTI